MSIDSDWEVLFYSWAEPPSATEQDRCDNAILAVRNAVSKREPLKDFTQVFPQGSYRNRVNVKRDSDVDIGVIFTGSYFFDLIGGRTEEPEDGPATYTFSVFKDDLEAALRSHFKTGVTRGNKAFNLRENSYHVDADVVPLFHLKEYGPYGETRRGVSLLSDHGGGRIDNYPERLANDWPNIPLHYENGISKNTATSRRYKSVVRIVKKLRSMMEAEGIMVAKPIPGYLIECLVFNVPDTYFNYPSWLETVRKIVGYLWSGTKPDGDCSDWREVDRIKYLFSVAQPWTKAQAYAFVDAAWSRIGL